MQSPQRGAALVVGLVMLLVLTVLAISTMRTAGLELTMAGNTQFAENSFQIAETGIDRTIQEINFKATAKPAAVGTGIACPAFGAPVNVNTATFQGSFQSRICYMGVIEDCIGSSIGKVKCFHYQVDSVGASAARAAITTNRQGFYGVSVIP